MTASVQIAGFSATDKVPGFFGETKTGQGPSSIQNVPMVVLVVGIMGASGFAAYTPYQITSTADADKYFLAGYQAARMSYAALQVPGAVVWAMGIPAASGAVAATSVLNISGTWSSAGTLTYRINGESRSLTVNAIDTPTTFSASVASDISAQTRWPVSATSAQLGSTTTYQVTLTHKTAGAGGNQQVFAVDVSQAPAGFVASLTSSNIGGQLTWKATQAYGVGAWANPITGGAGFAFKATAGGSSGSTEPTWPVVVGTTVVDGTVTWTCEYAILTGGLVPFFGGTGTESNTLAISAIANTKYDRIASGQNDATNLAAWSVAADAAAGPTANLLEQVVCATNAPLATAAALAQTTLNDVRCDVLWELNAETHPCEIAATFASARSTLENGNWAQGYDDYVLPGVAVQSQTADYPNHATLVAALNEGVTPIQNKNGKATIVRAIVSHCLNAGIADYSTLDTSDLTVPDQIRADVRVYWLFTFKPNNPVVSPDPSTTAGGQLGPWPPSGVATPKLWNAKVYSRLKGYEAGTGFPYPQLQLGSVDRFLPVTIYSAPQNCLLSAISAVPIAQNHQIGASIRGIQGGPASVTS